MFLKVWTEFFGMNTTPPRSTSCQAPSRKKDIFALSNKENFVFIRMVARGRATAWRSSLGPKTQLSSGLRPAKIDDNLFMECIQSVALLGEDDDISSFVAHVSRDNYAGHTTRVAKSRRTLNP